MSKALPVVAVTGLALEARIAQGLGVLSISGGGSCERTEAGLQAAIADGVRGVISFGTAGGLSPCLAPGDCLVPETVTDGMQNWQTDAAWSEQLVAALPNARRAPLAGVDRPVADVAAKRALHENTGAAAVDMESHIAALIASAHDLPFVALRIIVDPAERGLPPAALAAMRADGGIDIAAVLASLAWQPGQIPQMIRLALDMRAAKRALLRGRRMLGPGLGFPGFGVAAFLKL